MVTLICYGPCKLFNPNYIKSIVKMPEHSKALSIPNHKVIKINKSLIITKRILPAKC